MRSTAGRPPLGPCFELAALRAVWDRHGRCEKPTADCEQLVKNSPDRRRKLGKSPRGGWFGHLLPRFMAKLGRAGDFSCLRGRFL